MPHAERRDTGHALLFIDGEWTEATNHQVFATLNPATGAPLAEVPSARNIDVDRAVDAARRSFDRGTWRELAPDRRAATLRHAADLIRVRRDELATDETDDTGKPYSASLADIDKTAAYADFYASMPLLPVGDTLPRHLGWRSWTERVPVGVVAAIAPWNFAFRMVVMKTFPALACGNSVVLKTSELAPLAGCRLAEILTEAGLPHGVFNLVHGDGINTGASLVRHPQVDKITFTGSAPTGRAIAAAAAGNLTPCHLELGGKAPTIVFPDANTSLAAAFTAKSTMVNSGQICTAPTRLLVHRSVRDGFVEALIAQLDKLQLGDPRSRQTTLGPLISLDQVERVEGFRVRALEAGAVDVSPQRMTDLPVQGFWSRPSLLLDVAPDSEAFHEEIFGPVVTVTTFEDDAEAFDLAAMARYALSANVFTESLARRQRSIDRLAVGTVWVNSPTYRPVHSPFEGHLDSGYGVDGGVDVLSTFTRLMTVIEHDEQTT